MVLARLTLGLALLNRRAAPERDRGQKLLADVSEVFLSQRHNLGVLPIVNVYLAREKARRGDRNEAIQLMMSPLSLHRSWSGVGGLRPVLTRY